MGFFTMVGVCVVAFVTGWIANLVVEMVAEGLAAWRNKPTTMTEHRDMTEHLISRDEIGGITYLPCNNYQPKAK